MDLPPAMNAFYFGKSTLNLCPVFPDHYKKSGQKQKDKNQHLVVGITR
jgi:hypothetical protein